MPPSIAFPSIAARNRPSVAAAIEGFGRDALVISLGLDTFIGDPYAAFGITTKGFGCIASRINALKKPSVVLQEGGYICPELGANLVSYPQGRKSRRQKT